MLGRDRFQVLVNRPFSNDDNTLSLAEGAVSFQDIAHLSFPVIHLGWPFRDEDVICASPVGRLVSPLMRVLVLDTHAIPAMTASQPQCLPMTSTTKARECEDAVEEILSTLSQIRCNAVAAPIVRSVPARSLSMLPTRPTILRCLCASCSSCEILPVETNQF